MSKYHRWSEVELDRLRQADADGTPLTVVATYLGLSQATVCARAHKMGLRFGRRMVPELAYHPQVAVDRWMRQSEQAMRRIADKRECTG